MASKSIIAKGTTYNGVESVTFPTSPNGTATFYEISDTTATASDVLNSKYFYTAAGVKTQGTGTGGSATLITKNITQNGTYDAEDDDADGYSSVTVNVSGGGGSNWTLLASQEFTVNTSSTSNTPVGSITLNLSDYNDPNTLLWVHIRDKAGKRAGYYYGSDAVFFHYQLANENYNPLYVRPVMTFCYNSNNDYQGATNVYGVFPYGLYYSQESHYLDIYSRYSGSYTMTINGTFKCDVYKLTPPSGMTIFDIT